MTPKSILTIASIAAACWAGGLAAAELPPRTPLYQQWILSRTHFALVGGRVVNTNNAGWMFGIPRQIVSDGNVREKVSLNGNGTTGSILYSYQRMKNGDHGQDTALDYSLEINSEGRFIFHCANKDEPQSCIELTQVPGQPVRLSLLPADSKARRPASCWPRPSGICW